MPAQLSKGHTYNPGDLVDAPDLNALVDAAIAALGGGLITEQPGVAAVAADSILISDASDSGKLKKALISSMPGAGTVTSVGFSMVAEVAAILQLSMDHPTGAAVINFDFDIQTRRTFLAAPVAAGGKPLFRAIAPADLPVQSVDIALHDIDCTLGNVFTKTLPSGAGPFTLNINSLSDGQTIRVGIINNAGPTFNNVAWTVDAGLLKWRGSATAPAVTATANAKDIFTFTKIVNPVSTITYGYADQNFKP